jgi:hypothetical protein
MPGHRKAVRGRFLSFFEGCARITIQSAGIRQFIEA